MATFVLVPGAWHGAWCWERITPLLSAAGHTAVAPDPVGMGADMANLANASLASWADQFAAVILEQKDPVILVGHSRSGTVISEVAERVPDRVAKLAYLAAYLVPSGHSIASVSAQVPRTLRSPALYSRDDGTLDVEGADVGPIFYNTTPVEWIDRARALVTPEPASAMTAKLSVSDDRFGSVPRCYIECADDLAVPIVLQRHMQITLPCSQVFTLSGDHSPFYSAPEALTECLLQLVAPN